QDTAPEFSVNRRMLANISRANSIQFWGIPTGNLLHTFKQELPNYFGRLAISTDATRLITGGTDRRQDSVSVYNWQLTPLHCHQLINLPLKQLAQPDRDWLIARRSDYQFSESEQQWLALLAGLMDWRDSLSAQPGVINIELPEPIRLFE